MKSKDSKDLLYRYDSRKILSTVSDLRVDGIQTPAGLGFVYTGE